MRLSALIAGVFGIIGFVISVLAGLIADNSVESILLKAILAAGICYIVGYCVGLIGQQVSAEHAQLLASKVAAQDAAEDLKQREDAAALEAEAAQRNAEQIAAAPQVAPAKT